MLVYELKNVRKYRGRVFALDIPALTIEKGKFYAVYGPNASGKTTLLEIMAFLEKSNEGICFFYDDKSRGKNDRGHVHSAKISMVMQHPYLFKGSVLENVLYGLLLRSFHKGTAERMVEPVMRELGVWELRDRYVDSLSGGEAKKVALARALALDSEILLLDETTAHIDKTNADIIERVISRINKHTGKTIIMTTHNLSQAYRLTSDILYLVNGRLQDTPLWNIFMVDLIKSGDVINGVRKTTLGNNSEVLVATDKTGYARIVLNPKDIIVSRVPFASSALNNIKAKIVAISEIRGLVDIVVDFGVRVHAFITHRSLRSLGLCVGENVFVTFKASCVEVFDA